MFANVAHFYKFCMITSLCSVVIGQSERYIGSPFYQFPLSVGSFIFLWYHAQLAIKQSKNAATLHIRIPVFWNVMLCCWLSGSWHVKGSRSVRGLPDPEDKGNID